LKLDLSRKARFVAGGRMTEQPPSLTYVSVVSRGSVRLAFLIVALNDLDILSADLINAHLNALTKERVHTFCGPEFGHQFLKKNSNNIYSSFWIKVKWCYIAFNACNIKQFTIPIILGRP
jgi:hypothetical protein